MEYGKSSHAIYAPNFAINLFSSFFQGTAGNVAEFEEMLASSDSMQQKGVIAAVAVKNNGKSLASFVLFPSAIASYINTFMTGLC